VDLLPEGVAPAAPPPSLDPLLARLQAVERTLAWARKSPEGITLHMGTACAVLLESFNGGGEDLEGLCGALRCMDLSEGPAREALLEAAEMELGRLLPAAPPPIVADAPAELREDRPRGARNRTESPREKRAREERPREARAPEDRRADERAPDERVREERGREDGRFPRNRDERSREERGRFRDGRRDERAREDRAQEDRPRDGARSESNLRDGALPSTVASVDLRESAIEAELRAAIRNARAGANEAGWDEGESAGEGDFDERGRRRGRKRLKGVDEVRPQAPPAPPPPPPILPLGHPDGTGASVGTLGIADEQDLELLDGVGIQTIADLLLQAPVGHLRVARGELEPSEGGGDSALPDSERIWRGRVRSRCLRLGGMGRIWELVLDLGHERLVRARWAMRPPRSWNGWKAGVEVGIVGQLVEGEADLVLYQGEPVGIDGHGSGLLPEYDLPDLSDGLLRDLVAAALGSCLGRLEDILPAAMLENHRLLALDEALRDAHFPANPSGRGRVRMAFEELLLLQVGVAWRAGRGQSERGQSHKAIHGTVGEIEAQHGVTLDDGQELAFAEIRRDLLKPAPMTRLLQGDVGAGKGLVALMAAVVVAANGAQVAWIAPDVLAAERRYLHTEALLRSVGLNPVFVGEAPDHAQLDAVRRGEAQILFGTSQLLNGDIGWKRLGLVVVEERGPYGTITPGSIRVKGPRPDLLVITRAPIPSSLACTVFGDFDVSIVPTVERPRVHTHVLSADRRAEAYTQVQGQLQSGRQAYVVFPVQEGRDLLSVADAMRMAKALQAEFFPASRLGVYCSAMSREERSRVYDDFQHRRIDVLVCTTFIEDAPPVPNAAAIVVEYADLHDLVRLHRLRVHVGYGNTSGLCCLVLSDAPAEGVREQVELVAGETDGFRLAEVDLQMRGAGALLGDRAAEMPEFQWADPPKDRELLLRARQEAFRLVAEDPDLRRSGAIAQAVGARWGEWLGESLGGAAARGRKRPGVDKAAARRRRRRRRR